MRALSRRQLWLVAAACGLATVGLAGEMARRIVAYHALMPRETFAFREVLDPEFTWCGRDVTFTADAANPGAPVMRVGYGDSAFALRVGVKPRVSLPGLIAHTDWMRVLRFAPAGGLPGREVAEKIKRGEIRERLVIVTRSLPPGADPETWGRVWKRDWAFDFYELREDGTVAHERLKYPSARAMKKPVEGELRQNSWQFQAALLFMPRSGPTVSFHDDALRGAGWTLPAAAGAGLACVLAAAFAAAPQRRRAHVNTEITPP